MENKNREYINNINIKLDKLKQEEKETIVKMNTLKTSYGDENGYIKDKNKGREFVDAVYENRRRKTTMASLEEELKKLKGE